jgi:hypothetical protein
MSGSPAHEIGIVDYPGAQVACIQGLTDFLRHRLHDCTRSRAIWPNHASHYALEADR